MLILKFILLTLLFCTEKCVMIELVEPEVLKFSDIDFNKTKMFSTFSSYHIEEECKPIKIWMMSRHGTKHPSIEILSSIKYKLVPRIQDKLKQIYQPQPQSSVMNYSDKLETKQKNIIQAIINWKNPMAEAKHKELNDYGKKTMADFGKRMKIKLMPLAKSLTKDEIQVFAFKEWRCIVSGKKFLREFYDGEDYDDIDIIADPLDKRLEVIKASEDLVKIVKPGTTEKVFVEDYFFDKHIVHNLTKKIKEFLFPEYIDGYHTYRLRVTSEIIKTMYHACKHSFYKKDSEGKSANAWCLIFTFEELEMFEQMQDLQYFYKNGYFLKNSEKFGNPLAADILNFLTESSGIRLKMFFGHASTCLNLFTRFNLFNDNKILDVDNIRTMKSRKWKTSYMIPVGCNFIVAVYNCGYKTLRASIYVNETPLKMVLSNGKTCIKCPLDDIVSLITSFNTSDELEMEVQLEQLKKHQEKKKRKQMEKEEREKQIEKEESQTSEQGLLQRSTETFDEDKEYVDKSEKKAKQH